MKTKIAKKRRKDPSGIMDDETWDLLVAPDDPIPTEKKKKRKKPPKRFRSFKPKKPVKGILEQQGY
jgi:hypothetical protein